MAAPSADQHLPGHQPLGQDALVEAPHPAEVPVQQFLEAALLLVGAEQLGTQHRRQGQRDDRRYGHRRRQREGELGEQRAGQAALEADGQIGGHQHRGHRQNGAAQFAGREQCRIQGRLPLLQVPVEVLDHNDGIIDHQPDGQHQVRAASAD